MRSSRFPTLTACTLLELVLGLTLVLAPGCSRPAQPQADPDLIARIGTHEIQAEEFRAWMKRRAVGNDPAEKEALLREMLDHAALVQQAQAAGLDRDPELRRAWENLLISKLRAAQLEPQLTNTPPTPAQVQSYYQSNLVHYAEPALRKGAILFIEVPARSSAERKAQLQQRLVEARAKALTQPTNDPSVRGFGALAIEYSEDQATRYRGGDIGWVQEGRGDARFEQAAIDALFALGEAGALSEVLETPRGFYLVKLIEARPARVKPLEAVQTAIEHQLFLQNRQRLEANWKHSASTALQTEVFPAALARVQITPAPGSATSTNPPTLP